MAQLNLMISRVSDHYYESVACQRGERAREERAEPKRRNLLRCPISQRCKTLINSSDVLFKSIAVSQKQPSTFKKKLCLWLLQFADLRWNIEQCCFRLQMLCIYFWALQLVNWGFFFFHCHSVSFYVLIWSSAFPSRHSYRLITRAACYSSWRH